MFIPRALQDQKIKTWDSNGQFLFLKKICSYLKAFPDLLRDTFCKGTSVSLSDFRRMKWMMNKTQVYRPTKQASSQV